MKGFPSPILLHILTILLFLDFSFAVDTISSNQSISDTGQTLVSSGGKFELGFFSPGNSKNRYLGIWYKDIPSTIVWVANRNTPINDSSGVLKLSNDGYIVLVDRTQKVVWSSNSSRSVANPIAQLLESGNLLVRDLRSGNSESYTWQSFDYPCDTLLAGMRLGWSSKENRNWSLSSWKSKDDPSIGEFTYRIDPSGGLPQAVLRNGSKVQFRSETFGGRPELRNNVVYRPIYIFNTDEVYYTFADIRQQISRFVLNQSGFLNHLRWNDARRDWVPLVTLNKDNCDKYAICGSYGTCNNDGAPICKCPEGFTLKSQELWDTYDPNAGCVRRFPLNCKKGAGFLKFTRVKLPDKSQVLKNSTPCETECLNRCSCTAYAQTSLSSCVVWFGDLIDIKEYSEGGSDLYIRVDPAEHDFKARKMKIIIISVILGTFLLVVSISCLSWFMMRKKRKANREGTDIDNKDRDYEDESPEEDLELRIFDFVTITAATNNFSSDNKIGKGGFGPVYKGQLSTGQEIAVKRLSKESGQGIIEFKNEVKLIAKLQHRNLVRLLGCCIKGEERMLIYEYMPNKSLDTFIFDKIRGISLNWQTRFDIIVGIARGILYLHQDSRLRIIHRDLKASNVLLDSDMNPKISDFGAAKTFRGDQTEANTNRVVGTYGYMSPEYAIDGLFSMKSDVFSFGVLVLEIVSGKKNRGFHNPDHDLNLLGHVWKLWNEDRAMELIDAEMETPVPLPISEVLRCVQVGLLCVQQRPEDRPIMSSVVLMLVSDTATLPQPMRPGFSTERFLIDKSSTENMSYTQNELTASTFEGR